MDIRRIRNFLSWIFAGMAVGYAIKAIVGCASAQAALIPEPADPVWWYPGAPLDFSGLNFPDPDTPPGL